MWIVVCTILFVWAMMGLCVLAGMIDQRSSEEMQDGEERQ